MVKLITDSGADLPVELAEEYDIRVLPMYFYIEDREYQDGEIPPKQLYDEMRNGKHTKTAQLTYMELREAFLPYAESGEPIIYLCFSSELSGTYQTACMVKQELEEAYPHMDLTILDTKCASLGQGMVVYRIARLKAQGYEKSELVEAAQFYAQHTEHIFSVDDLTYLQRGGRVSKTSAFVGGMLNIKPVLNVDDGKLIPVKKVRGSKKVHKNMVNMVEERGHQLSQQIIGINHADDSEGAEKLQQMLKEKFGCEQFVVGLIGSVIGAHAGPGTLSVYFLNQFPEKFRGKFAYE